VRLAQQLAYVASQRERRGRRWTVVGNWSMCMMDRSCSSGTPHNSALSQCHPQLIPHSGRSHSQTGYQKYRLRTIYMPSMSTITRGSWIKHLGTRSEYSTRLFVRSLRIDYQPAVLQDMQDLRRRPDQNGVPRRRRYLCRLLTDSRTHAHNCRSSTPDQASHTKSWASCKAKSSITQ